MLSDPTIREVSVSEIQHNLRSVVEADYPLTWQQRYSLMAASELVGLLKLDRFEIVLRGLKDVDTISNGSDGIS